MRLTQEISIFNPLAIKRTILELNTSITQTAERIELQAEEIAVVNGKVDTATATLSVMAEQIESKVENSTFTSSINQLSNQISSEVTARQNGDNSLSSRITQNATAITSKVSTSTFNSTVTQLSNSISSKVSSGDVVSEINQSSDAITLKANRISIASTYFTLTKDGQITATKGIIGNSSASSANKWTIGGNTSRAWIYSGSKTNIKTSVPGVYIGTNGIEIKQSTGNTGNVTRIDGDGIFTTYIQMYDSGLQKSTLMYLDDSTDYASGYHRMLFPRGIATGIYGEGAANNLFRNYTRCVGGLWVPDGEVDGSDRRLKKNITKIARKTAIDFIKSLQPSSFKYKNGNDDFYHHGFIAQEAKKTAWDGLVVEDKEDGMLGIRYHEIIADIVAVLQDLLAEREV